MSIQLTSSGPVSSKWCHIYLECWLCIQLGIVRDLFTKWLLKKPNIDPSVLKNDRPIVLSTILAKLLEVHRLHEKGEHEFHDLQFGFEKSRMATITVRLAEDFIDYWKYNGFRVYVCSLDAEGAFDSIHQGLLFKKAMDAI